MICPMCEKDFAEMPSDILPGKDICPECADNIRTLVRNEDLSARREALAYIRQCKEHTHDEMVYEAISNLEKKNDIQQIDEKHTIEAQRFARRHSRMFDSVGEKIMSAAEVFWMAGIATSVILGVVMCFIGADRYGDEGLIVAGIAVAVIGSLVSWLVSLMMYGFGEMVNNSRIQTELAQNNRDHQ